MGKLLSFFLFPVIGLLFCFNVSAADTNAPVTTATKYPPEPTGKNGWYVGSVEVTLQSTDLDSGIKEINYQIDSRAWVKFEPESSTNLAPNASFSESDGNSPIYTKDWVAGTPDEQVYSRDESIFMPGFDPTSIRITSTENSWNSINNITYAVVTENDNMSAYAWIKTGDIAGEAYFKVWAVREDGSPTQIATSTKLL
jgi:hypothetical protein